MRYLDELTRRSGRDSGDRTPAQAMFKDHAVGEFLKARGLPLLPAGHVVRADAHDPDRRREPRPRRDERVRDGPQRHDDPARDRERPRPAPTPELTFRDRHREGTLFELRQLRRVSTAPGPKFVFAHILLPHDPYVFRADGSPITEAEAKADRRGATLYAGHLAFANTQIKDIVGYLLVGTRGEAPDRDHRGRRGPAGVPQRRLRPHTPTTCGSGSATSSRCTCRASTCSCRTRSAR